MKKFAKMLGIGLQKMLTLVLCFLFTVVVNATNNDIADSYGKLPLGFEANKGQVNQQVYFLCRGTGYNMYLTADGAILNLENSILKMKLLKANHSPMILGMDKLPGISNYFIGNDTRKWTTNIPTYAKVKYEQVYPGIDLIFYGNQRQLEYDFILAPGADPNDIILLYKGADNIIIDQDGNLIIYIDDKKVIQNNPIIYQETNGIRKPINGHYIIIGKNKIGFKVSTYDAAKPLIIDPILVYSTFLGGSENESGSEIVVDTNGNAYVTGTTNSIDFPISSGAFQVIKAGPSGPSGTALDIFVTKLSADGSTVIYSTYLGGSDRELGPNITINGAGNAYVSALTLSSNFPTTTGVLGETPFGVGGTLDDLVIVKLGVNGNTLVYSTYLGGSGNDEPFGITIDAIGNVYLTGHSNSSNYPTTSGAFQTTKSGIFDAVFTKINSNATAILYSTFIGGNSFDLSGGDIALDASGNIYMAGRTLSSNFPTTAGAFQTSRIGSEDVWVAKINPAGNGINDLVYSTFLGGSGSGIETTKGIAIDAAGNIYVTGLTPSSDFPTTSGAFQTTFGGGSSDVFMSKINPAGNGVNDLLYSTFIGGNGTGAEQGRDITLDISGNAYIAGFTSSSNFPVTTDALQDTISGVLDAFITKLNPAGTGITDLVFSTYFGGSDPDASVGITLDDSENIYVTGSTQSTDFPTTGGAFQTTFGGGTNDAFVSKINLIKESQITWCGNDTLLAIALREDTTLEQIILDQNRIFQQFIIDSLSGDRGESHGPVFVIPVVVHVISDIVSDPLTDIPDDQIDAQIDALNRAFSNNNGSTNLFAHDPSNNLLFSSKSTGFIH